MSELLYRGQHRSTPPEIAAERAARAGVTYICVDCGAEIGEQRIDRPHERCQSCNGKHYGQLQGNANRQWTSDGILDALRTWDRLVGEPPTYDEWRKAGKGRPTTRLVLSHFGSWNKAIVAAGLQPRPRGGAGRRTVTSSDKSNTGRTRSMVTGGLHGSPLQPGRWYPPTKTRP